MRSIRTRGKIVWQTRVGKGGMTGGVQWGMASDGAQRLRRGLRICRPPGSIDGGDAAPVGGANFDPVAGGGLTASAAHRRQQNVVRAKLSVRSAASRLQPGAIRGDLRDPRCGFFGLARRTHSSFFDRRRPAVWDFDTEKDFATVNGITANGGSLDGAGRSSSTECVYVNSGYPRFGGTIGNVCWHLARTTYENEPQLSRIQPSQAALQARARKVPL